MKNIVRAFVVVLTLTGSASYAKLAFSSPAKSAAAQVNSVPVPTCAPHDPNACGIDKH